MTTELTIEDPAERMAEVQRTLTLIDASLATKRADRAELNRETAATVAALMATRKTKRAEINLEIKELVRRKEVNERVLGAYQRAIKSTGLQTELTVAETNGDTDGTP
jgi:tellurite resistance protein